GHDQNRGLHQPAPGEVESRRTVGGDRCVSPVRTSRRIEAVSCPGAWVVVPGMFINRPYDKIDRPERRTAGRRVTGVLRVGFGSGAALAAPPRAPNPQSPDAETVFATRVLPLLKTRCFACHGDDVSKVKGGLDLTSSDGLLAGGDSGQPGVVPANVVESPVYKA